MGNKFEVWVWEELRGEYQYVNYYSGQSALKAFWKLFAAKREGFGCVKFEWR